jgi:sulfoxide reductase catalytic subunit YedY
VTEEAATGYNNYQFHPTDKQAVKNNVGVKPMPWKFASTDWASRKQSTWKTCSDDAVRRTDLPLPLCQAWAMTVPWTGFPMSELIKKVGPAGSQVLGFVSESSAEMPGRRWRPLPWPYFEVTNG